MVRFPPPSPWKSFGEPRPDADYLVVLTSLPVRRASALPTFLNFVRKINAQLRAGPEGLTGYSLLAQPLSSSYWTLSAWESPAAMGRFLRQGAHREAMVELPRILENFHTWRWESPGSALPPRWEEALSRPKQHG